MSEKLINKGHEAYSALRNLASELKPSASRPTSCDDQQLKSDSVREECATSSANDIGGVQEFAQPNITCPEDPTELWRWMCRGRGPLPPVMFSGSWQTEAVDIAAFRDRNVMRHFLRHAPIFESTPTFDVALPFLGDLVAAVNPPTDNAGVVRNSAFSAVRIDINTPIQFFAGATELQVTIGPAPGAPNAAGDTGPVIATAWTEMGEVVTRLINGWQRSPQVSLILPLGVVRRFQTRPNVAMAQWPRVNGVLVPFHVRVAGAAANTFCKAQVVGNGSIGIADVAATV